MKAVIRARSSPRAWTAALTALASTISATLLLRAAESATGQAAVEPVVYTVRFPAPGTHSAHVEARFPTDGRGAVELMMPVWTPGYYRVEDYASEVREFAARTAEGAILEVTQPRTNRWRIHGATGSQIVVTYRLRCEGRSVTRNWVGPDFAVLNGASAFPMLTGTTPRAYEVQLELPPGWEQSITALPAAPGSTHRYHAADYDTLVDSPILAGRLGIHEFDVAGSRHVLADAGELGSWDGARAAQELERLVRTHHRFWGQLPFQRYVFLNLFRQGGGGLEHRNSTLLTASPRASAAPTRSWLAFVSHEYFHAINVKRLRPVEFDSFDYENPARTRSLWVSEGLTTYYGEVLTTRAGIGTPQDLLRWISSEIRRLQTQPGRLAQTLEQASLEVWNTPTSGLARNAPTNTVSYYVKGPIVGFLLDAKIQRSTGGRKSLDDVMRLACARYSGEHGFTPEQFQSTAEEVAGLDLRDWFRRALASTEELDYAEALEWFGLQFGSADRAESRWNLEARPDVTAEQTARWRRLAGFDERTE